jgi:hypothetical protein
VSDLDERNPALLQESVQREVRDRQARIAQQRGIEASALAEIERITAQTTTIDEQIRILDADRSTIEARVNAQNGLANKAKTDLAEAQVKAQAERDGVEGTLRAGSGPAYREALRVVARLEREVPIADTRLESIKKELSENSDSRSRLLDEHVKSSARMAMLNATIVGARQVIKDEEARSANASVDEDSRVFVSALRDHLQSYRQHPDPDRLKRIQSDCELIRGMEAKVAAFAEDANQIDCDPKEMNEALAAVLLLREQHAKFAENCAGIRLPRDEGTSSMIRFARICLQDSGLQGTALASLNSRLFALDLRRDDKAQSFIVSLNAFADHNWLAHLALAIAITVDSLVFFAGLFGANTITGPLDKAGLRDVAGRVHYLNARDIRLTLNALRNLAVDEDQLEDPRINRVVTLGLERQVPGEPGIYLVIREQHNEETRYRFHRLYVDELYDVLTKAERRGLIGPEEDSLPESRLRQPRALAAVEAPSREARSVGGVV